MESSAFPEEDWQLDMDISSRGRHLLRTGLWSDVEFSVGEKEDVIKAHRLVLASASPVFAKMLYGPLAEEESPIRIPDVTLEIFNLLLEFVYTDNIEDIDIEKVPKLVNMNNKYRVPGLMKTCAKTLTKNVSLKNAIKCYELGTAIEYQPLINACSKIFSLYPILILESESALDARIDTLEFIFSQDYMTINSELDLLAIVEKYSKANEDKKIESDIQKKSIRRLLQKIRFFALEVSELAKQHQRLSKFLTDRELLSLMINYNCEEAGLPLPEGFTKIRTGRIITVPFVKEIRGEVAVGRVFRFVGIVNENPGRFDINLLEGDGPEANYIFHMSVRFDDPHEGRVVVRNTSRGNWLEEERDGEMPFEAGEPFEVTIEIERNRY